MSFQTSWYYYVSSLLVLLVFSKVNSEEETISGKLIKDAAIAIERATETDFPLFDDFVLARNDEDLPQNGTNRAWNFLESRTVGLDLTKGEARDNGGKQTEKKGSKSGKKGKKQLPYALMALFGIFGISGPLILKTLALIAGKALIASKIALVIVGSVILRKLFEKDHHPVVKVHTHTAKDSKEEDFDRNIDAGAYNFLNTI